MFRVKHSIIIKKILTQIIFKGIIPLIINIEVKITIQNIHQEGNITKDKIIMIKNMVLENIHSLEMKSNVKRKRGIIQRDLQLIVIKGKVKQVKGLCQVH
jgi:hypothetical protein